MLRSCPVHPFSLPENAETRRDSGSASKPVSTTVSFVLSSSSSRVKATSVVGSLDVSRVGSLEPGCQRKEKWRSGPTFSTAYATFGDSPAQPIEFTLGP
jgi:hypothetical protein